MAACTNPECCIQNRNEYTPKQIIQILRSIENISFDISGEMDIQFDGDLNSCVIHSFIPGSFTRELLELIEKHLTKE